MNNHMNEHYYILTGAIGAGKSTVLKVLSHYGFITVDEPAREIIAQQREIKGEGLYDHSPSLFYNLMLSRAIFQYKHYQHTTKNILGDRGIPDNVAYAQLFSINPEAAENAAALYRYNQKVFFFPAVEHIYINDDERKISFQEAKAFGEKIQDAYISLGYTLIEVPFNTPEMRAEFIINTITAGQK